MAVKGTVNTVIDSQALASIIVFSNRYVEEVREAADEIRSLCRGMEDEESLKGGDGEQFRESFATIATACNNLESSISYINKVLNEKLGTALGMNKGKTSAESADSIKAASNKTGVLKKQ